MKEDIKQSDNQVEKKTTESANDNSTADTQVDKQTDDHMIPKSRFDEVNTKAKTIADELAKYKEAEKERELAELKKTGEFEKAFDKVNGELTQTKDKLSKFEEAQENKRKEMLSSFPEDKKEKYANHPIEFIEDAVDLYTQAKGGTPKVNTSSPSRDIGLTPDKGVWDLSDKERKSKWSDILKHYTEKKN